MADGRLAIASVRSADRVQCPAVRRSTRTSIMKDVLSVHLSTLLVNLTGPSSIRTIHESQI
jgi:hypothetical protein